MEHEEVPPQKAMISRWIDRCWVQYPAVTFFAAMAILMRATFFADFGNRIPYITFYPAVLVAALFGGFFPGVYGCLLIGVAVILWRPPLGPLFLQSSSDWVRLGLFLLNGTVISGVGEVMRRTRARATDSERRMRIAVERKRVAEALRASEERFRAISDANIIGVVVADSRDHRIVEANDYYLNLLGVGREEMEAGGIYWPEFTPPEILEMEMRLVAEAYRTGTEIKPYEKEYRRRDGGRVPVLVGVAPLDTTRERVVAFVLDLSERKRAEQERDITIEFLRRINQSAGTRDLIQAATAFFQERSGCQAAGIRLRQGEDYPYYETRGFPVEFIQLENRLCHRNPNGEPLRNDRGEPVLECLCGAVIGGHCDLAKPYTSPGGSFFWSSGASELAASLTRADLPEHFRGRCLSEGFESLALIPLRLGEERLGLLQLNDRRRGIFTPETIALWERLAGYLSVALAKCRAEEALREANAALAETGQRKDEFLAMLAHELRNPLAPMRHALSLLRGGGKDEAAGQRQHAIMERQVGHMARLLDDLLDVSRVTRGKIELRRQPLRLGGVLHHALETAAPLARQKHQEIIFNPPAEEPCVDGDADRLAQIVGNLLLNAAKFTPEGGLIWLELGRENGTVAIRVRDSGAGIAPELLPHIFDLFVQGDSSTSRPHAGLGIGLTMARKLAELHGGTVEVRSAGLGLGSEFILSLPVLDETADGTEGNAAWAGGEIPEFATTARRVLIVDDVVDSAASLAELVESWGHDALMANDGPAALELIKSYRPEVVLLDLGMPGMDGFEVAGRLRQMPEAGGITLVALTGYGQIQDIEATRAAGFDHHMVKPVDLARLRATLAEAATVAEDSPLP